MWDWVLVLDAMTPQRWHKIDFLPTHEVPQWGERNFCQRQDVRGVSAGVRQRGKLEVIPQ